MAAAEPPAGEGVGAAMRGSQVLGRAGTALGDIVAALRPRKSLVQEPDHRLDVPGCSATTGPCREHVEPRANLSSHSCIAGFPATTRVLDPTSRPRIGHHAPASRTADAGRDVPGRQLLLPEPVEPAGGHVGQVERGGARAAGCRSSARPRGANWRLVSSEPRRILERKPRADQREPRRRRSRETDSRRSPSQAPAPERRGIRLLPGHVEHHAGLQLAIHRGRDRHRIRRKTVQEVGRAVERIHDPHQPVASPGSGLSSSPTIRLAGSAARRTSAMIRSAVRSTSVTKSRLPLSVHRLGSAGRSTLRRYSAARSAAARARCSKSKADTVLLALSRTG